MRGIKTEAPVYRAPAKRPVITSYDSVEEHSLEHWIALKRLVEDAAEEDTVASVELVLSRGA